MPITINRGNYRFHISDAFGDVGTEPNKYTIKQALESILSTEEGQKLLSDTTKGNKDYYIEYDKFGPDRFETSADKNNKEEKLYISDRSLNNLGASFYNEDGTLKYTQLIRVLAHELAHYSFGSDADDPTEIYDIKDTESYGKFLENANATTTGGAIDFANKVIEQHLGEDSTYRTQYIGTPDVLDGAEYEILSELNIKSFLTEDDLIKRTKVGSWAELERDDLIRTDSNDENSDLSDLLIGLNGNDTLISGGGRDFLFGGDGEDQLFAGDGNDVLVGGEHADKLSGGIGEDELFGEADNDYLAGGVKGDFTLEEHQAFFDNIGTEIYFDDEEKDILDGGEGNDTYYLFSKQEVIEDQSDWWDSSATTPGSDFFDLILSFEHAGNPSERNSLKFDLDLYQNVDRIRDSDGDGKVLVGRSVYEVDANQVVTKDYEIEDFTGDYVLKATFGLPFYVADGVDGVLYYDIEINDLYGFTSYTGFEYGGGISADWHGYHANFVIEDYDPGDLGINLTPPPSGTDGGEETNLTPPEGNDASVYYARGGDDIVIGTHGSDVIKGGTGNDNLSGEGGNDELSGGEGNDTLEGGSGNDYLGGGEGNDIAHGGYGNDTIEAGAGTDFITGGYGRDSLYGGAGNDRIEGGVDQDTLDGGDGADKLFGGGGRDEIRGGAGDDFIHGGDDSDTIEGGTGNDILSGGGGGDVYIYRLGDGNDTILEDYTTSGDQVRMQDIDLVDVTFHRAGLNGRDLEARILSTGEKLRVADFFDQESGNARINLFRFYDGEEKTAELHHEDIFALTDADNRVPVWNQTDATVSVSPGTPLSFSLDTESYSDADGDVLSLSATLADGSALPEWLSFDAATGTFTGTPPIGFGGTLPLLVFASDGKVSATKDITLLNSTGNAAPVVANELHKQTAQEDSGVWTFQLPNTVFADADNSVIQLSARQADGERLPDWLGFDSETGTFSGYLPEEFHGAVGLEVVASDGLKTASAFFTLVVDEVNDPVFAADDRFYATVDAPLVLTADALSANDADLDSGQFAIVSVQDAANCTVSLDGNGNVVVNATSQDLIEHGTFTYTISDGTNTSTASVIIDFVTESSYLGDLEYGTDGNDNLDLRYNWKRYYLDMGAGDDYVKGSSNNDIYFYDLGDGNDRIHEGGSSAFDRVFFSDNISVSDVTVTTMVSGNTFYPSNVLLEFSDGGSLTLMSQYNDNESLNTGIEEVHFADGTVWGKEQLSNRAIETRSTDGDDDIRGFDDRSDTIYAGAGNDILRGFDGSDTYVYELGDGNDTIDEDGTGDGPADRVVFGNGIQANAITFSNYYDDVTLHFSDGGSINILDQFEIGREVGIELFQFADGTVWGEDDLARFVLDAAATSGDDLIQGFSDRGDVIDGGTGNDTVRGMEGDDTYLYDLGDGNDVISENYNDGAADRLLLGDNILASQVTVSRSQSDSDDVTLHFVDGGSVTLDEQFYETRSRKHAGVEQIAFADGTIWTKSTLLDILSQPQNRAPLVNDAIADQSSLEDTSWSYTVPAKTFSDADGDALTLSATLSDGSALPAWLSFDAATRSFSGTPPQDFNGTLSLKVIASDGKAFAEDIFDLVINPVNDAPIVVSEIADQTGTEDAAWSYTVPADAFSDADGDALTYSATLADGSALPAWLSFDTASRTFSGTPPQAAAGSLSLKVIASDGSASVEDVFDLVIDPADVTPVTLTGTSGDDDFTYNLGDGHVAIVEGTNMGGGDRLLLGTGITTSNMVVSRSGSDGNSITLHFSDGGQVELVDQFVLGWRRGIEEIVFDDGTVWDNRALADQVYAQLASEGDDQITGFEDGSGKLIGLGGNDILDGGLGSETIQGGAGNDIIRGNGGRDNLYGQDGDDQITGSDEDQYIDGGAGHDVIHAEGGNDNIWSRDGDDQIALGSGDDFVNAGSGNDTIIFKQGETGHNTVSGFTAGAGSEDTLQFDVAVFADFAAVMAAASDDGTDTTITIDADTSVVISDVLVSDLHQDDFVFDGAAPANTAPVVANAIADQTGTEDAAWSYTVPADAFSDADGDALTYSATLADGSALPAWLSFDTASRTFSGTPPQAAAGTLSLKVIASDGSASVEDVFDLVIDPADVTPVTLTGTSGDDDFTYNLGDGHVAIVEGTNMGGGDRLLLGTGITTSNMVVSRSGSDGNSITLHFSDGGQVELVDQFVLGWRRGIEEIVFDDGTVWDNRALADQVYTQLASEGNDQITGFEDGSGKLIGLGGNDILDGGLGSETIQGGAGNDIIRGNGGRDNLYGQDGDDQITGSDEDQYIDGGAGHDVIHAEGGNDNIWSRDGDDQIALGSGDDFVNAGSGNDTIIFKQGETGHNTVSGFTAGAGSEDALQFDAAVFADFAAVMAAASDDGTDTTITIDADTSVVISDVLVSDLHQDDFVFDGAAPANTAPVVANAISNQTGTEDAAWSFTVPSDAFSDADGDALSYSATRADGSALPAWLSFDAASRTFSGTPPQAAAGTLSLKVIASDDATSAEDVFDLVIAASGQVTSNTIEKVSGGSDWYNGLAASVEALVGAGYIQSTALYASKKVDIGASVAGSQDDTSIDFYIWLTGSEIRIKENGSVVATVGSYADGDTFAIERLENGTLQYLKNDTVLYTSSTKVDPSIALHAHMSLYNEGAVLADTGISTGGGAPQLVNWVLDDTLDLVGDLPTPTWVGTDQVDDVRLTSADEVIDSGAGDDVINGGGGNDIFLWAKGDGNDWFGAGGGADSTTDVLIFTDVASTGVSYDVVDDKHITVTVTETGEVVTLFDQIAGFTEPFDTVSFADGTSIAFNDMLNLASADDPFV